jgi:transposase InsO family protein
MRNGDAIRAIRSDNGSEFKNSHFKTFCRDLGLEHQFSSPYVACQNGVVERKNHSLCEMARTMLDEHSEDHVWFEDRWMLASLCDE